MSSSELVHLGSVDDYPDESRAARRRRRRVESNRRFAWWVGMAAFLVFAVTLTWALKTQFGSPEAAANTTTEEAADTTVTTPVPPSSTTVPTPETLPTIVAPQWLQLAVAVPGWNGLGKLVTDGQPGHCERVLPGELGRSVIAIPFDPSNAGTINVSDGKVTREWRVIVQPPHVVAANDLASLCNVKPTVPTVVLVSSVPGDARPYVEAREA